MAYNYEYPHFDAGNYNSDWLLHKMKELEETVIGLETFKYIGENEILDLNQQKQNSIAAFTSNFNVLNSPVSNVQRVTVIYGSETAYIQQLYDLSNFTVYTRNYSTASGWTVWKLTQNKPGTNLHTTPLLNSGSLNDMVSNTATIANGNNVLNAPTHNLGFVITWNADDLYDKIQLWFDMVNSFCYIRYANPNWQPWVELNHIDLTNYLKGIPAITSGSLDDLTKNSTTLGSGNIGSPTSGIGYILTLKGSDTSGTMQIWFGIEQEIWIRYYNGTSWQSWQNVTRNFNVIHRIENISTADDVYASSFYNGHIISPIDDYAFVLGIGYSDSSDTYQIITTSQNRLYLRFRNGTSWSNIVEFQRISSTRSLTITSTPEEHSTDDEGRDRYMMRDNIYAESAKTMDNTYISLPGQSLLHSEEGKQSFKDAILAADLSDTDKIMTNLEMWDMDIPLDTIAEEVAALSDAITAKNPMCELTLLSIPPIDIPMWGDELLDYTMPNGSTLRQVDDRLFRLSEEHPFSYVSFQDFYGTQNANLVQYVAEDSNTNKQYVRRIGSFIKNAM